MKTNLLIFGTKNFNNSLNEIKEDLGFSFIYFDPSKSLNGLIPSISGVLVDFLACENNAVLPVINKIYSKPIVLLHNQNSSTKCKFDDKISMPVNFLELKSKIINLITAYKFNKNSSIIIKNYTLDKNEKKLKQGKISITITEKEVQLIELLFIENKPLSKKLILNNNLSSARLIGLDKITAKTSKIIINLGETKKFGPLEIKLLKCGKVKSENVEDNVAYLQVKDISKNENDKVYIFNGWTFSSDPTIAPFDHAIYDLQLITCNNV